MVEIPSPPTHPRSTHPYTHYILQAEGSPREYNLPVMIDLRQPGEFRKTVNVEFPARTVPGSQRVQVTAIGK